MVCNRLRQAGECLRIFVERWPTADRFLANDKFAGALILMPLTVFLANALRSVYGANGRPVGSLFLRERPLPEMIMLQVYVPPQSVGSGLSSRPL